MPKPQVAAPPPETVKPFDPVGFMHDLTAILEQAGPVWAQMVDRLQGQTPDRVTEWPLDPLHLAGAMADLWGYYAQHPSQLVELQLQYWTDLAELTQETGRKWSGEASAPLVRPDPTDRRFRDPLWQDHVGFDFIRQAYGLTRQAMEKAVAKAHPGIPGDERARLEFYTRTFLDALAPSNFAATNPEVWRETLKTGGENILKGLKNLIDDIKRGQGELKIRTTNAAAFRPGVNMATTKGSVVFRNRMIEVIQYHPTTKTVHQTPMLIVPPWINKYYILDLRPENSYVKFALDQGFPVFMISWVNPDVTYADVTFDDYLRDGWLKALDVVETITGQTGAHVVGYCIGGTLTAMGLSWLAAKRQSGRVRAATFLTTLLDFEKSGDLKVFVDDQHIQWLEQQMQAKGFLPASTLQKTFSVLRANDMIWSFMINNYLMGREPFPFDILYWNEDSTNLPAAFHAYYLRHMYRQNDLIKPGCLTVAGVKIDLRKIKTPLYFLSTKDDHIAPWVATYDGARMLAATHPDVRFVLAGSGHVAGVVNPPAAGKYQYWTAPALKKNSPVGSEEFLTTMRQHPGSWWTDWAAWATKVAGRRVKPSAIGHKQYKVLCPAPGTYVLQKASS